MATIRDIAKVAGVSQGTASNVLNGKGIVSSKKIKLVMQAAADMGYIINEKASLLRKGSTKTLALVLPDILAKRYALIFSGFETHAEQVGYQIKLYTTNDLEESEVRALAEIRANMGQGAAIVSCLQKDRKQQNTYPKHTVFLERKAGVECIYVGFDYAACGRETAELALEAGCRSAVILAGSTFFSNEEEFCEAAALRLKKSGAVYHQIQTSLLHCEKDCMRFFEQKKPDSILVSNSTFAEMAKNIRNSFYPQAKTRIYSIFPLSVMPERSLVKYELDYRLLGKKAAETLITSIKHREPSSCVLPNAGYRRWEPPAIKKKHNKISILSMNAPATWAMQQLSNLFTDSTGIEVNIVTFNYEELYDIIKKTNDSGIYDIVRLDRGWLPKLAEKILIPLEEIDTDIQNAFTDFMPTLVDEYARVNGKIYALPSTPSVQFLFYRRDIFEDSIIKRLYFEKHRENLQIPRDFAEFNRVAAFFTRSNNAQSPTEYGSVLTLENTSTAAIEFLTRYFSFTSGNKYKQENFPTDIKAAQKALQSLMELQPYVVNNANLDWNSTAACFARGEAAMAILFNNYTSKLLDYDSRISGKIGYALIPGGKPMFSGGVFGLTKKCHAPEESLAFIRWVCGETIATAMTMLGSVSPCKKTYENYDVIHTYPWLEITQKCFESSHKNRISANLAPNFDEKNFMEIIGAAVKNMYRKTITQEEALHHIQTSLYSKQ